MSRATDEEISDLILVRISWVEKYVSIAHVKRSSVDRQDETVFLF